MNNEPKELNIPLYKRHYFDFWLFIAYIAISALTVKPDTIASWIVTLVLVAPSFWFVFFGATFLDKWASNNRYIFAAWAVFTLKILFLYFIVRTVAPMVIHFIESWAHV